MALKPFEIHTEIVLCTSHISGACSRVLDKVIENNVAEWTNVMRDTIKKVADTINVVQTDGGYRIHALGADLPETCGFPELDSLLSFAVVSGCKWLLLDRDGPEHADVFKTFKW